MIPSCKINYVIAAWLGERRSDSKGGVRYLLDHLRTLEHLRQKLSQITIVLPEHRNNTELNIKKTINGVPVVVLCRPNHGMSYGSWAHAYSLFRETFDYYILIEDDYSFVIDDFDTILVDMYHEVSNTGLLSGLVSTFNGVYPQHAAISNSIVSSQVLESVYNKLQTKINNSLPGYINGCGLQIDFSRVFADAGFILRDFTSHYRSPFYNSNTKKIVEYAPLQSEYIMKPWHMLNSQ